MSCEHCGDNRLHQIHDGLKTWDFWICQNCGEITPKRPKDGFPFRKKR
jgi:ribosomal protein L37AE/L43A